MSFCVRSGLILFLAAVLVLSTCECIRDLRDYKSLFESRLPKGPVPPSGPSLCHNKFSPYKHNKDSLQDDYYIICP